MITVVGGTFSKLHKGHKALLNTAIDTGNEVVIGLTSDEYVKKNKVYPAIPYSVRYRTLYNYMIKRTNKFRIRQIDDRNGNAPYEKDYEVIVVSPETYPRSLKINEIRISNGLPPLKIIRVPYVLAQDLFPISSTRIINGEIDTNGKRITPLKVGISTRNEAKIQAVEKFVRRLVKNYQIVKNENYNLKTQQPFGEETMELATQRAMEALKDNDYSVGIESGIIYESFSKKYYDVHYCVVIDRFGNVTRGMSSGFEIPDHIVDRMKRDRTFSEAYSGYLNVQEIDQSEGIIGKISEGKLRRIDLIEESIRNAFILRLDPDFYDSTYTPP
ncbi:conserved hypothetical protein [Thermoplasma acidophilum]|uniref:Bifunctional phosphopantetheine adenylyltransferase/NTP phosphatase n=1 Tax=Thermoplasma acidophilum (strain ATCC 25905 / DSM 1728 / JCM 9062 / NBRC 15155 / AMRC-C165) TaxID=273075 RepID=COPP_THEAC|nr:bifunctional pantetheine-phosphate adenylyltransferase/NTP phosphatase [Thermoplasma acidophilum]Q9HIY2.1 RecName: Full=Bifunctional phosphopantetheine adenylyltransferase/NTP phosphatase; Includes: RecName: Full=Phosphopantetheine adenylyltransferase; AltName: Full=Dephospho-CoA pyrophosphorylase; AltName: Full=Pantetheine-phosphate adenylyltransferase; Short=PPAT; Includes: RecName: Full=Probable inosine/xanthosine triphosphatase; AltName: Full=Non-canonical purine NTP phosphatase; AltName: F